MTSVWDTPPSPDEYGSFYQTYIDKLGAGNIIDILMNQSHEMNRLVKSIDPEKAMYRYTEGKWTVKEVIGHLIDTERIFAYRALSIARNDPNELPGYDQEEYVEAASFNNRSLQNLGNEYTALRKSNIHLFNSFTEEMLDRRGTANNYSLTVRAIPFIIAGHERHHMELLVTKYDISLLSL